MILNRTIHYCLLSFVFSIFLMPFATAYATDIKIGYLLLVPETNYKEDVCPIGQEYELKVDLDNSSNNGGGPFTSPNTKVTFSISDGFKIVGDYSDVLPDASMESVNGKTVITADYGDFQAGSTQEVTLKIKSYMPGNLTAGVAIEGDLFDPSTANNSSSLGCSSEGVTMKVNGMPTYGLDLSGGIPTYQYNGGNLAVTLSNNLSDSDEKLDYYFVAQIPGGDYYSMAGDGSWLKGISPAYSGQNIQFDDFPALNTGQLPAGDYYLHYGITFSKEMTDDSEEPLEIISLTTLRLNF